MTEEPKNVAIVAHVDHGQTLLVDELLKVAAASTNQVNTDNESQGSDANTETEPVLLERFGIPLWKLPYSLLRWQCLYIIDFLDFFLEKGHLRIHRNYIK